MDDSHKLTGPALEPPPESSRAPSNDPTWTSACQALRSPTTDTLASMASPVDEPGRGDIDLPAVLAALADRGRLISVRALAATGEANCTAIVAITGLGVSKSTMSHHLRVLRQAGITHTRVAGAHRFVSLRRDDLEARFPGLLEAVLSVAAEGLAGQEARGGCWPEGRAAARSGTPDGDGTRRR